MSSRDNLRRIRERWERVDEFPGYYVSDHGNVENFRTRRRVALTQNQGGVVKVNFNIDGVLHTRSVAVLVAELFVAPPEMFADESDTPIHLNGDPTDNHFVNLAWRPRWFAWKYTRQFHVPPAHDFHLPVLNHLTKVRFPTVMEAGMEDGILWEYIAASAAWNSTAPIDQRKPVYPTGATYGWVR